MYKLDVIFVDFLKYNFHVVVANITNKGAPLFLLLIARGCQRVLECTCVETVHNCTHPQLQY